MTQNSQQQRPVVGIVGAGKLGTTLGQLLEEYGYPVQITGKPDQPHLELIVSTVLPTAKIVDFSENLASAEILLVAIPQSAVTDLDFSEAGNTIVVDATNAWEPTDGAWDATEPDSFEQLRQRYPQLRLVRSLNQAAYTDLLADSRPAGHSGRKAVAVAGTSESASAQVANLVAGLGFDPVVVPIDKVALLDVGGPIFGQRLDAQQLTEVLS